MFSCWMGNKIGKKRQVVDEKYTRPQGLYVHQDVDHKKLKKLILGSKLAPCYPGDDDCGSDLEECPICFMYYPSLNRSRCCMKGICTECFLQMKTPNSTRPAQCPFCKTSNYAVEFRGVKTKEEKGLEQIEEQRVIEAKIRMRQKELQDDDERIVKQRETSSLSSTRRPTEADYCSTIDPSLASTIESEEIVASHETSTASSIRLSSRQRQNREDNFDLDLEDLMVMEAIWLSIQENGRRQEASFSDAAQSEQFKVEKRCSVAGSSSSSSGGLACAIAALAERQQTSGETCNNYNEDISTYNTPACSRSSSREVHESETYFLAQNATVASSGSTHLAVMGDDRQWVDSRPQVAEVGSSIIPESFEEQMMLAMAVSLAEA